MFGLRVSELPLIVHFAPSGHLTRHSRIHTGEKNFACPFPGCEIRCSRQDNLQQQSVHLRFCTSISEMLTCLLFSYRIHLAPGSRRGKKSSGKAQSVAPSPVSPHEDIDESSLPPLSPAPALVPARVNSTTPPRGSDMSPSPEIKREYYDWEPTSSTSSSYESYDDSMAHSRYEHPKLSYESAISDVYSQDQMSYTAEPSSYVTENVYPPPSTTTYSDTSSAVSSSPNTQPSYEVYSPGAMPVPPYSLAPMHHSPGTSRRSSYRTPSPHTPSTAGMDAYPSYASGYQHQQHQQSRSNGYYGPSSIGGGAVDEQMYRHNHNSTLPPLLLTTPLSTGSYRPRSPLVPPTLHQQHSDCGYSYGIEAAWRSNSHSTPLQ